MGDISNINLYCSGTPLEDGFEVAELNGLTVDVTVGLLGGKVHGSLARAGKVRGQTPKVEAGEKKKKKTGRAKRRSSTTGDSSTLWKPLDARRAPTPTLNPPGSRMKNVECGNHFVCCT